MNVPTVPATSEIRLTRTRAPMTLQSSSLRTTLSLELSPDYREACADLLIASTSIERLCERSALGSSGPSSAMR